MPAVYLTSVYQSYLQVEKNNYALYSPPRPAPASEDSRRRQSMTNNSFGDLDGGLPANSEPAISATIVAPAPDPTSNAGPGRPLVGGAPLHSTGPGGRSRWGTLVV